MEMDPADTGQKPVGRSDRHSIGLLEDASAALEPLETRRLDERRRAGALEGRPPASESLEADLEELEARSEERILLVLDGPQSSSEESFRSLLEPLEAASSDESSTDEANRCFGTVLDRHVSSCNRTRGNTLLSDATGSRLVDILCRKSTGRLVSAQSDTAIQCFGFFADHTNSAKSSPNVRPPLPDSAERGGTNQCAGSSNKRGVGCNSFRAENQCASGVRTSWQGAAARNQPARGGPPICRGRHNFTPRTYSKTPCCLLSSRSCGVKSISCGNKSWNSVWKRSDGSPASLSRRIPHNNTPRADRVQPSKTTQSVADDVHTNLSDPVNGNVDAARTYPETRATDDSRYTDGSSYKPSTSRHSLSKPPPSQVANLTNDVGNTESPYKPTSIHSLSKSQPSLEANLTNDVRYTDQSSYKPSTSSHSVSKSQRSLVANLTNDVRDTDISSPVSLSSQDENLNVNDANHKLTLRYQSLMNNISPQISENLSTDEDRDSKQRQHRPSAVDADAIAETIFGIQNGNVANSVKYPPTTSSPFRQVTLDGKKITFSKNQPNVPDKGWNTNILVRDGKPSLVTSTSTGTSDPAITSIYSPAITRNELCSCVVPVGSSYVLKRTSVFKNKSGSSLKEKSVSCPSLNKLKSLSKDVCCGTSFASLFNIPTGALYGNTTDCRNQSNTRSGCTRAVGSGACIGTTSLSRNRSAPSLKMKSMSCPSMMKKLKSRSCFSSLSHVPNGALCSNTTGYRNQRNICSSCTPTVSSGSCLRTTRACRNKSTSSLNTKSKSCLGMKKKLKSVSKDPSCSFCSSFSSNTPLGMLNENTTGSRNQSNIRSHYNVNIHQDKSTSYTSFVNPLLNETQSAEGIGVSDDSFADQLAQIPSCVCEVKEECSIAKQFQLNSRKNKKCFIDNRSNARSSSDCQIKGNFRTAKTSNGQDQKICRKKKCLKKSTQTPQKWNQTRKQLRVPSHNNTHVYRPSYKVAHITNEHKSASIFRNMVWNSVREMLWSRLSGEGQTPLGSGPLAGAPLAPVPCGPLHALTRAVPNPTPLPHPASPRTTTGTSWSLASKLRRSHLGTLVEHELEDKRKYSVFGGPGTSRGGSSRKTHGRKHGKKINTSQHGHKEKKNISRKEASPSSATHSRGTGTTLLDHSSRTRVATKPTKKKDSSNSIRGSDLFDADDSIPHSSQVKKPSGSKTRGDGFRFSLYQKISPETDSSESEEGSTQDITRLPRSTRYSPGPGKENICFASHLHRVRRTTVEDARTSETVYAGTYPSSHQRVCKQSSLSKFPSLESLFSMKYIDLSNDSSSSFEMKIDANSSNSQLSDAE